MKKRLFMFVMALALALGITTYSTPLTPAHALTQVNPTVMIAVTRTDTAYSTYSPPALSLSAFICVQIGNGTDGAVGTPANVRTCNYNNSLYGGQEFQIQNRDSNGNFTLWANYSGKCLQANSATAGSPVLLNVCDGTSALQSWRPAIGIYGATIFALSSTSGYSQLCIAVNNATLVLAQSCSEWTIILKGGSLQATSDYSGRCLDVDTSGSGAGLQDGAKVQQWDCGAQYNQRFNLQLLDMYPSGHGTCDAPFGGSCREYYYPRNQIVGFNSGKCLRWTNYTNGSPVLQYTCTNGVININNTWGDSWLFSPIYTVPDLKYQLRSANWDICMDMDNANGNVNGAKIQAWQCLNGNNQSWIWKNVF